MKILSYTMIFQGERYVVKQTTVPIGKLKIDRYQDGGYQRDEIPSHIDGIINNFNPFVMNPLVLGKRKGDTAYYIINGQQEFVAITRLVAAGVLTLDGPKKDQLPARIIMNTTRVIEAGLYDQLQNNRKNTAGDTFRARFINGQERERDIVATLAKYGLTYNTKTGSRSNHLPASALLYIYNLSGDSQYLDETLYIVTTAWTDRVGQLHRDAQSAPFLMGLGRFLFEYADRDNEKIIKKLKKLDPSNIKRFVKDSIRTHGYGQPQEYARYFERVAA